jgi:hypothetical protein
MEHPPIHLQADESQDDHVHSCSGNRGNAKVIFGGSLQQEIALAIVIKCSVHFLSRLRASPKALLNRLITSTEGSLYPSFH